MNEEELQKRLIETFHLEMDEHLQVMSEVIPGMKFNSRDEDKLNLLFRAAHSLKGAARSVGNSQVEDICHVFESFLSELKKSDKLISKDDLATALKNLTALKRLRNSNSGEQILPKDNDLSKSLQQDEEETQRSLVRGAVNYANESIRLPSFILDDLLANTSELKLLVSSGNSVLENIGKVEKVLSHLCTSNRTEAIQDIDKASKMLSSLKEQTKKISSELQNRLKTLEKVVLKSRLKPISDACEPVEAFLRSEERTVNFEARGVHHSTDRYIVERLTTVLMHLARNSIEHGFEDTQERVRQGKAPHCKIEIEVRKEGRNIRLLYADDGKGIDRDRLRKAIVGLGDVSLNDDINLNVLFQPGVSTSEKVSKVSGRGVGLYAVQCAISEMRGSIAVESTPGNGIQFDLVIPQDLANFDVLIATVADTNIAIDPNHIEYTCSLPSSYKYKNVHNHLIEIEGKTYPIIELPPIFIGKATLAKAAIVLKHNSHKYVLIVDQLVGLESVIVRTLFEQIGESPGLSGAAIRDGRDIALLIDVAHVVSFNLTSPTRRGFTENTNIINKNSRTVLVVEDSITTRILEIAILEEAGYKVLSAEDGEKALALLHANNIDLVVSDVDMPIMNGFELTRKIRATSALKSIPVILLTARENSSDKLAGLEAGANAYMKKGQFDQSGLLEIIKGLIGQ